MEKEDYPFLGGILGRLIATLIVQKFFEKKAFRFQKNEDDEMTGSEYLEIVLHTLLSLSKDHKKDLTFIQKVFDSTELKKNLIEIKDSIDKEFTFDDFKSSNEDVPQVEDIVNIVKKAI